MFNTGLPPLDRQGLFPSHGGILDPLNQASSSPFSPFTKKPPESPHHPHPTHPSPLVRPPMIPQPHAPPKSHMPPNSALSPLLPQNKPARPPIPQTVNLASESDEEVLVDDFDGQCCRTYPDNHSRILKWRAQREEKAAKLQARKATSSSHRE